jgi:hypothetical protein
VCLIVWRGGWRGSVGGEHIAECVALAPESSFEIEASWHRVSRITPVYAV